jgi:nucleoside-diphosphate-sugar epimerase
MNKIAIMGASGHVAKNVYYQLRDNNKIYQFSREEIGDPQGGYFYYPYSYFLDYDDYDIIINCVGHGNPADIEKAGADLFFITEKYDNMAIDYLREHPSTKYIFISSGVVHNDYDIYKPNFYLMSKLNAEAKHRALLDLNIIDIRLYSFFTRFINLDAKFFMAALIKSIKTGTEFVLDESIMVRDYINPQDLTTLISICVKQNFINDALDIYSLNPVEKYEIVKYFQEKYHLKLKWVDFMNSFSSVGKNIYRINEKLKMKASNLGYVPKFSSMDTIREESKYLLS